MRKHTVINGELVDDRTQELTREISTYFNTVASSLTKRQMAYWMANNEHRTLQQSFAGFVSMWIGEQASNYQSGNYDLRNEATVTWANEIVEKVGTAVLPFI